MNIFDQISIILPTLNERKNLEYLIPEIIEKLENEKIVNYEIIIVDDGSTDGTKELITKLVYKKFNVRLIQNIPPLNLPLSIKKGIENSNFKYVMWLDADGSMGSNSVQKLIAEIKLNPDTVIIGSRFVSGGGYKGQKEDKPQNTYGTIKRILNSEDSILAVYLSKLFNSMLKIILHTNVKDITSGFIVGKKEYFNYKSFIDSIYGEYFIKVISHLEKNNVKIKEVGYFCTPRLYGESKTSSSYIRLFKLTLPYIKAALNYK
jgi:dolichol-phosphate mannosyltransferase